ncbi:hypothetical protein CALVIDRAFT_565177 [Calocera viscosa TUFC12733]|uniref:F-box domain-containing protein n=1 Tax=Calocera viscosa (strain TUFC12733) TaxID=1330018 RepID=A0A167KW87_CALVF|nr:hypothetical protein CALVIDRAFT_565177 [Calocera viscosa TUFC12733]
MAPSSSRNPLDIPELLQAILTLLDDPPDLVNVACTCKSFTDIALRTLWREPTFDGSPLLSMVHLFPEDIRASLATMKDPNLHIPPAAFIRFDYYAHFIRSLNIWHHGEAAFVVHVLTRSRPGVWIFPLLDHLHLGATGEDLETAPVYLTPSLKSLYLNHWDGLQGREIHPSDELKRTFLQIHRLPHLNTLDLADTLYTPLEDDEQVVEGFAGLAARLDMFHAQSFLTLPAVFEPLARNLKLRSVFFNAMLEGGPYVALDDIIILLRENFPTLGTLGLYCTMEQAVKVFGQLGRPLPHLNLKISSGMDANDMLAVATSVSTFNSHILSLRISAAGNMSGEVDPPIRLPQVLTPLRACGRLRDLEIMLGFDGEQMLQDNELSELFRAWPDLEVCTILNDAEGDLLAVEGEQTSFGLSLDAILSAARHCPQMRELSLPFVDTATIPSIGNLHRSKHSFHLQLSRSHVHNHSEVLQFISRLWPAAEITFSGCDHYAGIHMKVVTPPTDTTRREWLQDGI